jgi:hypothetical protein
MRMNQIVAMIESGLNMVVDGRKRMIRMDGGCTFNTVIAKIVIATLETFVSDSDNVLELVLIIMK